MTKHSNRRLSIASLQHLRAPAKVGPNSSSRADGLWRGAPQRPLLPDSVNAIGRNGRFISQFAKYP